MGLVNKPSSNQGVVLITGGYDPAQGPLNTAELYDPMSGTFIAVTGTMTTPRISGLATVLNGGKIVIALDLTKSVVVKDAAGRSECEKNMDAVTRALANVPVNSRITVIGITDQSFT